MAVRLRHCRLHLPPVMTNATCRHKSKLHTIHRGGPCWRPSPRIELSHITYATSTLYISKSPPRLHRKTQLDKIMKAKCKAFPSRFPYAPTSPLPHTLGAGHACLVGQNQSCSVSASQGYKGIWSYGYGNAKQCVYPSPQTKKQKNCPAEPSPGANAVGAMRRTR